MKMIEIHVESLKTDDIEIPKQLPILFFLPSIPTPIEVPFPEYVEYINGKFIVRGTNDELRTDCKGSNL
jgi:hypothetical protein